MFFSQGNIEVFDNKTNKYSFSEIYIDEKNRKIVGSDVKSFFNDGNFKNDEKNEPRFFANSAVIDNNGATFQKGIFTTCKNREEKNVRHGQFRLRRFNTVKPKKQFIMIMQY